MISLIISDDIKVSKNGYYLGTVTHGYLERERATIWRVASAGSGTIMDFPKQSHAFSYLTGESIEVVSNGP